MKKKKMRLNLDDLKIESFETTVDKGKQVIGGVCGNPPTAADTCVYTCGADETCHGGFHC